MKRLYVENQKNCIWQSIVENKKFFIDLLKKGS